MRDNCDSDMQGHGTEEGGNGTMDDDDSDIQGHGTEEGGNGMMDDGDTDMHVGSVSGVRRW